MDQDAPLIRLAVFGKPVKHSLSPRIHTLFAQQADLPVEYLAMEVDEEFLSREIQALADRGAWGCNITAPLKHRAFQLASAVSERARLAEAANTLVFESSHRWKAHNTDGAGLVRDLARQMVQPLRGAKIAIIGAGGAVAGVLGGLLAEEPESICIYNRSESRASDLARRFSSLGNVRHEVLAGIEQEQDYELVINATSLAHRSGQPLDVASLFAPDGLYYDLNYGQSHQGLADWAHKKNIRCIDGLGMLVEQAAESFYLWTEFRAETAPVIETLRDTSQP